MWGRATPARAILVLYCGNNTARQPLQGKFYKLSIWEKFHFSSWIKIHGFPPSVWEKAELDLDLYWIPNERTKVSASLSSIKYSPTLSLLHPPLQQSFEDYLHTWYVLFQSPLKSWMILLLYPFISFQSPLAAAVSHCLPSFPMIDVYRS